MFPRRLLLVVALIVLALTVTVVPAPFTIDESNYVASLVSLRHGRLSLPGTEELPASRELLFFDPGGHRRRVEETPVHSTAPPLYAPLALPFFPLGWRGLVALNTLCFAATALLVFAVASRWGGGSAAGGLASAAFVLGGYGVEYAQGLWPHMLTVALVAASFALAARALEEDGDALRAAVAAGFVAAVAAGVRYQNFFLAACLGVALLVLARRRIRAALAFGLGTLTPLAACAAANRIRFGSWNPVSKGPGYLPRLVAGAGGGSGGGGEGVLSALALTVRLGWARVVDYSTRPLLIGSGKEGYLHPDPTTGAWVLVGAVKKAWLQSSPWIGIALVVLVLAWLPAARLRTLLPAAPRRHLRLLSIPVFLDLAMFSFAGRNRTDGFCFNQRYFLELVPLVAVALGWAAGGLVGSLRRVAVAGAVAGASAGALLLAALDSLAPLRHVLLLRLPLLIALFAAVTWSIALRRERLRPAAAALLGISLGWGLAVHLGDDLPASRTMRRSREAYLAALAPHLGGRSAVFAAGGVKDALGALLLEEDLVVLDPTLDGGESARSLIDALHASGRRVFVARDAFPPDVLAATLDGLAVEPVGDPVVLLEVHPS